MSNTTDKIWEEIDKNPLHNIDISETKTEYVKNTDIPKVPQVIIKAVRKAIVEFDMLSANDKILIGLSGGKDSTLLLYVLKEIVAHTPFKVTIAAMHIDLGFLPENEANYLSLKNICEKLNIPFYSEREDLSEDILHNPEQNPCSRCSYWRRALIHGFASRNGFNKVAFAHHLDDAVETFLMGLLYSGQLGTFSPVTYLDKTKITVIRPFCYVREKDIKGAVNKMGIIPTKSPCPIDGTTHRQKVKELIRDLCKDNPMVFDHLASAMRSGKRQNLWPEVMERKLIREKNLAFWSGHSLEETKND